jgi:hypothetical protein
MYVRVAVTTASLTQKPETLWALFRGTLGLTRVAIGNFVVLKCE